jgi:co-chaperonin GroES (HSP10)
MMNKSGLVPVGRAVLCRPYDPELNRTVLAIPDHVRQREIMGEMRCTVLELGAYCWPDEPPRAAPGDRVLVSKFTGAIVKGPLDGEFYRLVNDEDIFCKITSDAWDRIIPENPIAKGKQIERTTSSGVLSVPRR